MAQDAKQRLKKLAKKAQKRKQNLAKKKPTSILSQNKSQSYTGEPVYDCLVPDEIFEKGIGTVIFSRKSAAGAIAVSAFIVDVHCLGIKNALFNIVPERDYKKEFRSQLMNVEGNGRYSTVAPADARKLIDGAVEYARELGFTAHKDFSSAYRLFGDVDASDSTVEYEYGKDGKPFYIRGPYEDMKKAQQIVDKLTQKCGPDGFVHIIPIHDIGMFD